MRIFIIIIALFFNMTAIKALETCSRVATINFQEILVDPNTSQKGDGLRYFLEKDPEALKYLDEYQKGTQISWRNAVLGSLGTGFLFSTLFVSDSQDKKIYLASGATLILLNFLVSRTLEVSNEQNLNKAIEEYNKRNLPKIFFTPQASSDTLKLDNFMVGLAKTWDF